MIQWQPKHSKVSLECCAVEVSQRLQRIRILWPFVTGQFELAKFVAGEPGGATGVDDEAEVVMFEDLGSLVEAASAGTCFCFLPRVVLIVTDSDAT